MLISIAKARLQDLLKDPVGYLINGSYVGNKQAFSQERNFDIPLIPGTYNIKLKKNSRVIYEKNSLTILPNKVYVLIAKGVTGGTGIYKESVEVVQHN